MLPWKSALAILAAIVAVGFLLLGLTLSVGGWMVRGEVIRRSNNVFDRIGSALDLADRAIEQVRLSLDRAAERLEEVRQEQRAIPQQATTGGMARRLVARKAQRSLAPELGNANEKMLKVAEAATIVNSVIEDLSSFPPLSVAGLDANRLVELNGQLSQVSTSAWELTRLLGESDADTEKVFLFTL